LDALSQLDFNIRYLDGATNILADALSRIYSEGAKGTERANSEYVSEAESNFGNEQENCVQEVTRPLVAGLAAAVATESGLTSEGVRRNPARARVAQRRYDPEILGREGEVSAGSAQGSAGSGKDSVAAKTEI
jgi:hypothetical protein